MCQPTFSRVFPPQKNRKWSARGWRQQSCRRLRECGAKRQLGRDIWAPQRLDQRQVCSENDFEKRKMVLNDWDERWLIKGGHSLHERMTLRADLKSLMQSADFASQTRTVPSLLPLNKRVTQSFQSSARAKAFFTRTKKQQRSSRDQT